MNITGIDHLIYGANDLNAAVKFMQDFGLTEVPNQVYGRYFESLDGTGILVTDAEDPALPAKFASISQLRKMVYGVANQAALDAIQAELSTDREVKVLANGALESVDDVGITIGFQITTRRELNLPVEKINAPGAAHQRGYNQLGVDHSIQIQPRTLGHTAVFVPDAAKAEQFYVNRLGFRVSDRLGGGPFLRSGGTTDHHTLFLIQAPEHIKGVEHISFHLSGPSELMLAGQRFEKAGHESFWGPGRHGLGSNWFWYFDGPLGCRFEYDADMDQLDENWTPRELPLHEDNAQAYLLEFRKQNWAPFNGPTKKAS